MNSQMRVDARRNYLKLIEAAGMIFSGDGASASLEQVAKAADVGIATLYRHFPTRKDLLLAVYGDDVNKLISEAHKLHSTATPMAVLSTWLHDTVEFAAEHGGFSDLIALILDDNSSPFTKAAEQFLKEAQEAGSLREDVVVSDVLQFIPSIVNSSKTGNDKDKTERMLSVVIDGLRK